MEAAAHRVLVVEDHPIFRDGVVQCREAEADFTVVGTSDSTAFDAQRVARLAADLVLMDVELLPFGEDRTLHPYPCSLGELVDDCVRTAGSRASARQVRIEASLADVVLPIDKRKLAQVLGNLLENAVDASPSGGRVEIALTRGSGVARVTVRDQGAGVPPGAYGRLFTPFFTTKPDGIGLGLVLALELTEAQGGVLRHEPAPRGGHLRGRVAPHRVATRKSPMRGLCHPEIVTRPASHRTKGLSWGSRGRYVSDFGGQAGDRSPS